MKENTFKVIIMILVFLLILSSTIYLIITTTSPVGIIKKEDVGSFLGFLGSVIGGAMTLIGVWWTIDNQEKLRKKELDELEERRKDDRRVSVAPFLSYDVDKENIKTEKEIPGPLYLSPKRQDGSDSDTDSKKIEMDLNTQLIVHNVGLGLAINTHILEIYYDDTTTRLGYNTNIYLNINEKATIHLNFVFPEMNKLQKMNMKMKLGYYNILNDFYEQTVNIRFIITPTIIRGEERVKYNCTGIEIKSVEKAILSDPSLDKGLNIAFVIP